MSSGPHEPTFKVFHNVSGYGTCMYRWACRYWSPTKGRLWATVNLTSTVISHGHQRGPFSDLSIMFWFLSGGCQGIIEYLNRFVLNTMDELPSHSRPVNPSHVTLNGLSH